MFTKHLQHLVLCVLSLAAFSAAQTLKKQIEVPGTPTGIAVNSLNNRVYVAQNNWDEESSATFLSIIDATTNQVLKTTGGPGDILGRVAVDVVTGRVYVMGCTTLQVAEISCRIGVYDADLNGIATITDVGLGSPLAVNPITHRLYYARESLTGVAVLDTRTNTYLGRINVGGQSPSSLAMDLEANHLFAFFGPAPTLAVIDAHASKVLKTFSVGDIYSSIALDPYRHHVFVSNYNRESTARSTVTVLNSDTLGWQKNVLVGVNPAQMAVDTFTGKVFVVNARYSTLYVISEDTLTATKALTGPNGPIDVNPNTKSVYTGTVTVYIEPITGKVDVIGE